ncbi:MAG: type II toxin-antitoxin system RelE/ParE family toxin [Deinococcales bacterium]
MAQKELIYYQDTNGAEPCRTWLIGLKDKVTRARIEQRLERMAEGHYGDYKDLGKGIFELKFFFGSGYRIYFAEDGDTIVLLLKGGDKSSQTRDIKKALGYWQDYLAYKKERS